MLLRAVCWFLLHPCYVRPTDTRETSSEKTLQHLEHRVCVLCVSVLHAFLQVSRRENGARHHHSASLSSLQPQKTACSNSVSWRYRRERLKMEGSWDHTVSQNNLCPNHPRDGDPCLCVMLIDHASRTPQFFQIDSTIIFPNR
jgi:hypothetical protein